MLNQQGAAIAKEKFLRANDQIRFSPLVVIDEDGTNLGTMGIQQAKALAYERGLDLVEINPMNRPPICKLMDYGKYKYEQSKKEKQRREKQKESELKEVRLTAKIGEHDIAYKAKQAREFVAEGNKVKISLRLKGRENIFFENALDVFKRFARHSGLIFEQNPTKMGNMITATASKIKAETEEGKNETEKSQSNN